MNITVVSAEPLKVGGDLYKIVLELKDDKGKLSKRYEIWVLNSVIQHQMKIDISPAHKELARFGIEFFKQRIQEAKFNIPENGAFISAKGVYFEDPIKFPELLKNAEIMIQTNVILPNILHDWAKIESAKSKMSMSELIRFGLQDVRQRVTFREKFQELFDQNEKLHDIANSIFDGEHKHKGNGYKSNFIGFALGKAYKTHEAIITLCQRGYGEDAAQLVRTLFDLAITTVYIFKDPTDERVSRYLDFGWILKKNMYDHILNKPEIRKIMEEREKEARPGDITSKRVMDEALKAQKKYKFTSKYWWSDKKIKQMCEEVGRIDAYNTVYRLLSQLEHSSAPVANDYLSKTDNGFVVDVVRDFNWIEESLVASFDFYYHIIKQFNEYCEVGLDEKLQEIENEYIKKIGKL